MTEHRLVDATLIREGDGIVARCVCGWRTAPCFSSFLASAYFEQHVNPPKKTSRFTKIRRALAHPTFRRWYYLLPLDIAIKQSLDDSRRTVVRAVQAGARFIDIDRRLNWPRGRAHSYWSYMTYDPANRGDTFAKYEVKPNRPRPIHDYFTQQRFEFLDAVQARYHIREHERRFPRMPKPPLRNPWSTNPADLPKPLPEAIKPCPCGRVPPGCMHYTVNQSEPYYICRLTGQHAYILRNPTRSVA